MLGAMLGFSSEISKIEKKCKLAYNKSDADSPNIIASLAESGDTHVCEITRLIQELNYVKNGYC